MNIVPIYETLSLIVGLTEIVDIAAGADHCVALDAYGTVYTWGNNYYGQLGNGLYGYGYYELIPMPVWIPDAVAVWAAGYKSFAYTPNDVYMAKLVIECELSWGCR